ncbi:MAG: NADP-dependent isocitrate dehydrogenase, partial [Thermoplasmata archaeon]
GELDKNDDLVNFSITLEKAVLKTIEDDKIMTQDMAKITEPPIDNYVDTEQFINAIKNNLEKMLKK